MIRLDRFLSEMGVGSRADVKKQIRWGKVTVDGRCIRQPEFKMDEQSAVVTYKGMPVAYQKFSYYMLNKPAGVVSATADKKDKTVLDLIEGNKRKDLFPVGRLDKDTEGLLLLTNDGELAHRLLSPKKHVDKVYYARVAGIVTDEDVKVFAEGMEIGDGDTAKPSVLKIVQSGEESEILLTIQEGKFHQVKRMFHAVGKEVVYLKRLSMGTLTLDENLQPGQYRVLTDKEIDELCSVI